jgi:DNA-binding transcriptional MerR regulator
LTTHVIRSWEQCYHAVEPRRTPTNHRLHAQNDIERLTLLRDVTRAGHNLSQVARLTNDKLRALAAAASGLRLPAPRAVAPVPASDSLQEECLGCVQALDGPALTTPSSAAAQRSVPKACCIGSSRR